jgi:predicted SnoaL-like aldol condensation-catalyzing enzyme
MKLLFTLTFLTLAQSSSVEVDSSVPAVSDQENRNGAVATRVFEEIFNQGRFDVANEIYAPEFRNHGLRRDIGLEKDQNAVHREKQAFPDLKMTIDLLLPKGEFVTVVWTSGERTPAPELACHRQAPQSLCAASRSGAL